MKPVRDERLRLALQFAILYEESFYDSWKKVKGPEADSIRESTLNNIKIFKELLGE